MSHYSDDGDCFYSYAMDLFSRAGHVATSDPVFFNHSAERFVFFDVKVNASLSREQRMMLKMFNNISWLFSFNGCLFLSINLLTTKNNRSQLAHDIHSMIHPLLGFPGSICLFKCDDSVMLSFVGFGLRCMLSDWFPEIDDSDELVDRLHISNMSIDSKVGYFIDLVYALARSYYFLPKYLLLSEYIPINYFTDKTNGWLSRIFQNFFNPINYFTDKTSEEIARDELNQLVDNERFKPQREYGDDYVEYDETEQAQESELRSDLEMMLLELDEADKDIGNPFGKEPDPDEDDEDDEFYDGEEDSELDWDEYDDVDPEIFRDPTLMVKWLKKLDAEKNKQE